MLKKKIDLRPASGLPMQVWKLWKSMEFHFRNVQVWKSMEHSMWKIFVFQTITTVLFSKM